MTRQPGEIDAEKMVHDNNVAVGFNVPCEGCKYEEWQSRATPLMEIAANYAGTLRFHAQDAADDEARNNIASIAKFFDEIAEGRVVIAPREPTKEMVEAFLNSKIYLDPGITAVKGYEKARRKIRYRYNEYCEVGAPVALAALKL